MGKDGFGVKSFNGNTTILNNGIKIQGKYHIKFDEGSFPTIVGEEEIIVFGTTKKDKVNIDAPYGGSINLFGGGDRAKITGKNVVVKEMNDRKHKFRINKIDMEADESVFKGGTNTKLNLTGNLDVVKSDKVNSKGNNNKITAYRVKSQGDDCNIFLKGKPFTLAGGTKADISGNNNTIVNNDGQIGTNIKFGSGSGNKAISKSGQPCKFVDGDDISDKDE